MTVRLTRVKLGWITSLHTTVLKKNSSYTGGS